MNKILKVILPAVFAVFIILFLSVAPFSQKTENNDKYVDFILEVRGIIEENYWEKFKKEEINHLFLSFLDLDGDIQTNKKTQEEKFENILRKALENKENKENFTIKLVNSVLINLEPLKRSALYTKDNEKSLENTVFNKSPEGSDFYSFLNINQNFSPQKLERAYKEKVSEIKESEDPKKQEELRKAETARETLSHLETKNVYNKFGFAEPTIEARFLTNDIGYIKFNKISPQTYEELIARSAVLEKEAAPSANSLIIDLRGNIGGSIDILPYFLGPFIGKDQYAYEFYSQEKKTPFKTKTGWLNPLVRYKRVIVLIDKNTQSSAEVIASVLKKYTVGVLVGETTKGWGTVERVFPVKNQINKNKNYSVFLVHSLTIRADGQPIEGRGVNPHISINDTDWQEKLYDYIPDQKLISAVSEIIKNEK